MPYHIRDYTQSKGDEKVIMNSEQRET